MREWCLEFYPACHEARPAIESCTFQPETQSIEVTWSSDFAFDRYLIERDGVCIASLDGAESTYVDADPGLPGYRRYVVHGEIAADERVRAVYLGQEGRGVEHVAGRRGALP